MTTVEQQDLKDRLSLIESMIAEGRRKTESWGWTFVLWGVAYYVAIAWSAWGHSVLAWPVTMVVASLLTVLLASRASSNRPETTIGRAMAAIWIGMGVSAFIVMMSLGLNGKLDLRIGVAIIATLLGAANATSSILLKWKMQFACAVVWWATSVVAAFGSEKLTAITFLVALFICQILFGIYGMIREARKSKSVGAGLGAFHA